MKLVKFVFSFVKKFWWTIILLGLGVFVVINRINAGENSKDEARTYAVTRGGMVDELSISGYVDAREKTTLRFQTSGLLSWVGVKEGDFVNKYQVLASLDKKELRNQMTQLLNTYTKQRWDFEQAHDDNRDWEVNGMTSEAREAIQRSLEKEQMDLNNSVLTVEAKNLTLKFANLWTPIEGVVTKIDIPLAGQNITPAGATIEVVNPKTVYFSAVADQTEVTKFALGQTGRIVFDAYPEKEFVGVVESVAFSPKAGESGTVYEIKIGLDLINDDQSFKLGMTGDANFVFAEYENVINIPESYIEKKDGAHIVTVIEGDKKEERTVEIGKTVDGNVEIKSGLSENERIYH